MKSSPSIWHYVVSVKSSIFVAFLENTNFIWANLFINFQENVQPTCFFTYANIFFSILPVH